MLGWAGRGFVSDKIKQDISIGQNLRRLRKKAMTRSILDEVEGLGEVRKKAIWKQFGSLKNLKAASVEEISEVVPEKVAENIYHLLHHLDQIKDDA